MDSAQAPEVSELPAYNDPIHTQGQSGEIRGEETN